MSFYRKLKSPVGMVNKRGSFRFEVRGDREGDGNNHISDSIETSQYPSYEPGEEV